MVSWLYSSSDGLAALTCQGATDVERDAEHRKVAAGPVSYTARNLQTGLDDTITGVVTRFQPQRMQGSPLWVLNVQVRTV